MKGRQYGLVALATHRWRSLFAFYTNTLDMLALHIAVEKTTLRILRPMGEKNYAPEI